MTASESDRLKRIDAWSTFATAVVAAAALIFAVIQLRSTERSQRETTAQETYREYLKLVIEKSDYADGMPEMPKDKKRRAEYLWFVSYFLHASEQILLVRPDDTEWREAIISQVRLHKAVFADPEWNAELKKHYDKSLLAVITDALEKGK